MAKRWSTQLVHEMKQVKTGDQRLNERCLQVIKALGSHPDQSIPESCGDWSLTKGTYRFFENDNITREIILEPHQKQTERRAENRKEILSIQDTTYLNYTSHRATDDLGPIGTLEGLQGLVVHNTLAVDPINGDVLGLLDQEVWAREGRHPRDESNYQRRQRTRESERWKRGIERVEAQSLPSVIHVMDREGDIYEVLVALQDRRYVIRAARNRLLTQKGRYVFDEIRRSEAMGKITVAVPSRPGQKKREALVTLRCKQLTIRPPVALGRRGEEVMLNVLEAYEHHAPKGSTPLHWVLLTSEPIETAEQCVGVVNLYKYRWRIEEFHKSLKTGCRIEERQLKTRKKLEAVLGLFSIISVMLLRLRDTSRQQGMARDHLSPIQLCLLRERYPRLSPDPTAREAWRSVAKLGGFLARKHDGDPGWQSLWSGMHKLLDMEYAFHITQKMLLRPQPN